MHYEKLRYLRRQDHKLPTGQKIEETAPVRIQIKTHVPGLGLVVAYVVNDYTGRATEEPRPTIRMDELAVKTFYRLEPVNRKSVEKDEMAVRNRIAKDDLRSRGRGV